MFVFINSSVRAGCGTRFSVNEVYQLWIQSFPSGPVAISRLKCSVCPSIHDLLDREALDWNLSKSYMSQVKCHQFCLNFVFVPPCPFATMYWVYWNSNIIMSSIWSNTNTFPRCVWFQVILLYSYIHIHIHTETYSTIMTNEHTSLENIPLTLYSRKGCEKVDVGYVCEVSSKLIRLPHIDP